MATYDSPEQRAADAKIDKNIAEAERNAALNVAADESINRDIAEAQAVDARIAAHQANRAANEMATDRNILSHELAHERAAATNNAFGFYLTLGVLVAALIVAGFYVYWRNQQPNEITVNAAPAPPAPTTVVTPTPAPSTPPIIVSPPAPAQAPASRPPVVNVQPPAVHNDIHVTQPANPPSDTDNGATGGTSNDTNNNPTNNSGTTNSGSPGTSGP